MRALIVKTSSLGDVIHTLPAVTDAARAVGGITFDWVVEQSFADIPSWHPAVARVVPVAMRRWRREPLSRRTCADLRAYRAAVRVPGYDRVIDAQGLVKSAVLARIAPGIRCGMDRASAREPLASLAYERRFRIGREEHAIERSRRLFAHVLDYPYSSTEPDYGILRATWRRDTASPFLVFLHGTTWSSKLWPEVYWKQLAELAQGAGLAVSLLAGNEADRSRAERIAEGLSAVTVLPPQGLEQIAALLASAVGAVGVDTGLSHLAAALDVPGVTIYGSTNPNLTGTRGRYQTHAIGQFVCAPCMRRECHYTAPSTVRPACYESVPPQRIWDLLTDAVERAQRNQRGNQVQPHES
jgi:heptosyltransferase-1